MVDNVEEAFTVLPIKSHDNASSGKASHSKFKEEQDKTSYTIFTPKERCGFFSWNPNDRLYKPLASVRFYKEIISHITYNKPNVILSLSKLTVPTSFSKSMPRKKISYEYPYGHYDVASFYVASMYRNGIFNEIDFVFDDRVLNMVANKNEWNGPFVVCRISSTTNALFVALRDTYDVEYSSYGYQFKRYVATDCMDYAVDPIAEFKEHLHIKEIGNQNVLMCVSADSIDNDGSVVKIRYLQEDKWGTQVLFQMISKGSPTLCQMEIVVGRRRPNVDRQRLLKMKALKDQMKDAKEDEIFQISFDSQGELQLRLTTSKNFALLPPSTVVKKLLQH